jgi:hypothetical protein
LNLRERNIVSSLDCLLLVLLNIGFDELDELLTIGVHPSVMLITGLVANSTLDVWPPCIQVGASCIFDFFTHKVLFFLLVMNLFALLLRSNL